MAFYVVDDNNNKFEALDKEGVIAALEKAIADGSIKDLVADEGFITKLKCCVSGTTYKMAFTTQANYNILASQGQLENNTFYYIIDDTTAEDLDYLLEQLTDAVNELDNRVSKLESVSKTTYKVTTNKDLFIIPTYNTLMKIQIEGQTTVEAVEINIQAPCMLRLYFKNEAGTKDGISVRVATGGDVNEVGGFKFLIKDIAYLYTTSDDTSLVPSVTFSESSSFKVLEF